MKRNIRRLLKKETGTWVLAGLTFVIGGISIWSSKYLVRKPIVPATPSAASASCTTEFSIAKPTPIICNNEIDILGITIDRSSSMTALETDGRQKLAWAKEAAIGFVKTLQASQTSSVRLGVASFGAQGNDGNGTLSSAYNSTLNSVLTSDFSNLINNVLPKVAYVQSGTCIECGLRIARSQLQQNTRKKVVILFSDGKANRIWNGSAPGGTTSRQTAINEANKGRTQGIEYYVLGYGTGTNIDETTLKAIAGPSANYQYKPDVTTWSQAMLNVLTRICNTGSGPTATRSITATQAPMPTSSTLGTVSFTPTEDSYISSKYSATNYGSAATVESSDYDSTNIRLAYLKFDLSSLAGKTLTGAKLRVTPLITTGVGKNFKVVSPGAWTESTIKWSNKPSLGTSLGTYSASVTAGKTIEIPLNKSVVQSYVGKVFSFGIDNTGAKNNLKFYSRNSSSNKPALILTY